MKLNIIFPVELTEEMEAKIDRALVPNPRDEVLSDHLRLSVRRADIQTLADSTWLNDEVGSCIAVYSCKVSVT